MGVDCKVNCKLGDLFHDYWMYLVYKRIFYTNEGDTTNLKIKLYQCYFEIHRPLANELVVTFNPAVALHKRHETWRNINFYIDCN